MDCIPVVGKLNLFFQKENVDVALIKVNIVQYNYNNITFVTMEMYVFVEISLRSKTYTDLQLCEHTCT
jgi:hypothetical protein